jgi:hypothetical protein
MTILGTASENFKDCDSTRIGYSGHYFKIILYKVFTKALSANVKILIKSCYKNKHYFRTEQLADTVMIPVFSVPANHRSLLFFSAYI